jgi:hypothetical protein
LEQELPEMDQELTGIFFKQQLPAIEQQLSAINFKRQQTVTQ